MKHKITSKKLQLNKITVANVDTKDMKQVLAGDAESLYCMPTGEPGTVCCETYRTCPNPTNTCRCGPYTGIPTICDTYNTCIYC